MSAPDASRTEKDSTEPELVDAGVYPTYEKASEFGLVVLALGHPYWLAEGPAGVRLLIEPGAAPTARAQLAAYARESGRWPPPPVADPWSGSRWHVLTPLLWAAVILAVHRYSLTAPAWFEMGALDAERVYVHGEAWRPLTALFLHGSAGHVISNALGGVLVFSAVVTTLGRLRGWLLLLIGSFLGNAIVAAASLPGPYRSVGASTALFAGIGLLAGRAVRVAWNSSHPHRWRAMFAPFAAAAIVLGLYGAGGQRVDVPAHLAGFVAGITLGFVAGLARPIPDR
jgi:membrane associated rhomboid family serine protease